jgi:hypothetical protein
MQEKNTVDDMLRVLLSHFAVSCLPVVKRTNPRRDFRICGHLNIFLPVAFGVIPQDAPTFLS